MLNRRSAIRSMAMLGALSVPALAPAVWAASPPAAMAIPLQQRRYDITARSVALALSASGAMVAGSQVDLLAKVVATDPSPVLDIQSVEPFGRGQSGVRSKVKLACHLAEQCLPFYVVVTRPVGEPGIEPLGTGPSTRASALHGAVNTEAGSLPRMAREITMRAGAHALLVMDDHRSRIQVTVISLENGIAGHRIRVASPDRKQIYYAEVVSATLLKGSF